MEVTYNQGVETNSALIPDGIVAGSLAQAPALIERLLPVQKLSAEAYKEQMAVQGKTLTALGSYWKGRKPLILNRACLLGCLLPANDNPVRDLAILEMLLGMDDESLAARQKGPVRPKEILQWVSLNRIEDYFDVLPAGALPVGGQVSPLLLEMPELRVSWRADVSRQERRRLEAQTLLEQSATYRERVSAALRPEEVPADDLHFHIWREVNEHLGTQAQSIPELVEQLGIMRFGHRPRVADTFSGSGQIPFEAARLGCDVYASDLNPVACMLTWGAFNIVGGQPAFRAKIRMAQAEVVAAVQKEIDELKIETDGNGWTPKTMLYCLEMVDPQTGWNVPLLSTRLVSKGQSMLAELVPNNATKRFDIIIRKAKTAKELQEAEVGTIWSDGRGQDLYVRYVVDERSYKEKISALRGDYRTKTGNNGNRLRLWEKSDFQPKVDDLYQERLYAIQWSRPKKENNPTGKKKEYEFRSITSEDLAREATVSRYMTNNLAEWQANGWVPDMLIEQGGETDRLMRERGWTYWHHLFSPRQLLYLGLASKYIRARADNTVAPLLLFLARTTDWSSKLCRYGTGAARESVAQTFYN